jgi:hypothetical protein
MRMAAFYPGQLLGEQLRAWKQLHPGRALHVSFDSEPAAIRMALLGTDVVLIDATCRPSGAEMVLREASLQPGGYCTAVYSEVAQHRLESIVRQQGSWFLLGPLSLTEWERLLEALFDYVRRVRNLPAAGARPSRLAA